MSRSSAPKVRGLNWTSSGGRDGFFFNCTACPLGGSCVAVSEGEKDSVRLSAPLLILIQGPMTPQGPLRGIWRVHEPMYLNEGVAAYKTCKRSFLY